MSGKQDKAIQEAKAKVLAQLSMEERGQPGMPINVPAGCDVIGIIADDCDEAQARRLRLRWERMGAFPDPDGEVIVPSLPGAEVWLMHIEASELMFQLKKKRNDKRKAAARRKAKSKTNLYNEPLGGEELEMMSQMKG